MGSVATPERILTAMESPPDGRRIIRREVSSTKLVRREVKMRLGSTSAMRLGAKLLFRGFVARLRRRKVELTLRADATGPASVAVAGADTQPVGPGDIYQR